MKNGKILRCAVYTRKSVSEGLEKDFNTLVAQREAGENYIRSQKQEGWIVVDKHYDDGGFSGGNMERPALRELFDDIENGKIDIVVVYKVDRLSRSPMSFCAVWISEIISLGKRSREKPLLPVAQNVQPILQPT